MWLSGAADLPQSDSTQIILGIFTLLGLVVSGLVAIAVANINARNKTPPPSKDVEVRLAVVEHRAEDSDERFDVLDRKVEHVTAWIYRQDPEWKP